MVVMVTLGENPGAPCSPCAPVSPFCPSITNTLWYYDDTLPGWVDSGIELDGGGSSVTVDDALSTTSENPVQNKVVTAALNNKGTYSKPSAGIPKSDLASDVQTSLGKADTALQQHQSLAGYATESYVQTQIANIPDELPTVTAADNGKFLRVVSGAWAAATVPSAESNSFGGGA